MKTKRKTKTTEITVERRETWVVRKSRRSFLTWCEGCGAEVRVVAMDEAARVAGVSVRAVYGWVETGRVHFVETADGGLFICLVSLGCEDE
jgi:hypothetical protein